MKKETIKISCNVFCVATEPIPIRDWRTGRFLRRFHPKTHDPLTGPIIEKITAHNLITTLGKVLLTRFLAEESGRDTGVTWLAIGTGLTAPAITDTQLTTETARKAVATPVYRVSNRLEIKGYFPSANCNVFVKEVGLFGHSTASATANSGDLFNHALLSKDNSGASPVDLTFYIIVTIG